MIFSSNWIFKLECFLVRDCIVCCPASQCSCLAWRGQLQSLPNKQADKQNMNYEANQVRFPNFGLPICRGV